MFLMCVCVCETLAAAATLVCCFVTVATHSQARQGRSIAADERGKGVFALTRAAYV